MIDQEVVFFGGHEIDDSDDCNYLYEEDLTDDVLDLDSDEELEDYYEEAGTNSSTHRENAPLTDSERKM